MARACLFCWLCSLRLQSQQNKNLSRTTEGGEQPEWLQINIVYHDWS